MPITVRMQNRPLIDDPWGDRLGLTLSEDLDGEQVAARYDRADLNRDGIPSRFSHMALARVGL